MTRKLLLSCLLLGNTHMYGASTTSSSSSSSSSDSYRWTQPGTAPSSSLLLPMLLPPLPSTSHPLPRSPSDPNLAALSNPDRRDILRLVPVARTAVHMRATPAIPQAIKDGFTIAINSLINNAPRTLLINTKARATSVLLRTPANQCQDHAVILSSLKPPCITYTADNFIITGNIKLEFTDQNNVYRVEHDVLVVNNEQSAQEVRDAVYGRLATAKQIHDRSRTYTLNIPVSPETFNGVLDAQRNAPSIWMPHELFVGKALCAAALAGGSYWAYNRFITKKKLHLQL